MLQNEECTITDIQHIKKALLMGLRFGLGCSFRAGGAPTKGFKFSTLGYITSRECFDKEGKSVC